MVLEAFVITDAFLYVFEANEYIARNTCLQKISVRNEKPTMEVFHCSTPTAFSTASSVLSFTFFA